MKRKSKSKPVLFDLADEEKRERLRAKGWVRCPLGEVSLWRGPGSTAVVTEDEAISWLEREERKT